MTRWLGVDVVKPYFWTVLSIALITGIGKLITPFFSVTNVAVLYLLPVLLSAVYWGRPSRPRYIVIKPGVGYRFGAMN